MTKNTYYKFLHKHHLSTSRSKFKDDCIYTFIEKCEYKDGVLCINDVPAPNFKAIPFNGAIYNYMLKPVNGRLWLADDLPQRSRGRKASERINDIPRWIADLLFDDKAIPFDELDIDPSRRQKLVQGGAIKFASHALPLEDIYWRPGIGIVHGILGASDDEGNWNPDDDGDPNEGDWIVRDPDDDKGNRDPGDYSGMTKEEVKEFLGIHRNGDRADWWILYQLIIRHEYEDLLDEAPKRSFALFKKAGILLTIPVAYPNTTAAIKNPGSRVWDPF